MKLARTIHGLVGLIALASCDHHGASGVVADGGATSASVSARPSASATASASASASATPETPPPPTDYKSLVEAERDGDKANGKTVLVQTTRGALFADAVKLRPCVWDVRDVHKDVRTTYPTAKRDLVRAIPAIIGQRCTRVVIRLTSPKTATGFERATFVDAIDVHPSTSTAPPPPSGVDYGSTDDLLLAGDAAVGKVAQIPIRRTSAASSNGFDAQPCDVPGVSLRVDYESSQQALVDALPSGFSACRAIRINMKQLTDRREGTWHAAFVDVAP
jgi:hypothetical protein